MSAPVELPAAVVPAPARRRARLPLTLLVGTAFLLSAVALGVVSLVWLPFDLADTSGGRLEPPGTQHWMGTDRLGRDTFSFIMAGTRIALTVGVGSSAIAMVVGTVIGLIAAFSRGWLDDIQSSLLDVLIAFPTLLLAMLIGAAQGASLGSAVVSIGLAASAIVARLTRILAKRLLGAQFVTAARTSGTGWLGIIRSHLLPNMWPTLVVAGALIFGAAVLAEASLSYLGLGVPPPNSSLGRLLQESQSTVNSAPWGAVAPGVVIVIIVLGANFVADGLRERLDPTRRERS
ncbi:ABC transporter permease [Tessaracoccus sp. Y36]